MNRPDEFTDGFALEGSLKIVKWPDFRTFWPSALQELSNGSFYDINRQNSSTVRMRPDFRVNSQCYHDRVDLRAIPVNLTTPMLTDH